MVKTTPAPTKTIPDTTQNNTNSSTDLTDSQWAIFASVLPPPDTSGRPPTTNLRHALNAMFYRLKTGCQWSMLPPRFRHPAADRAVLVREVRPRGRVANDPGGVGRADREHYRAAFLADHAARSRPSPAK